MVGVEPDSEETCLLLEQLQTGKQEAFDDLFARYRPWLRRLVEMRWDVRVRARLDPSDVVQEAQMETFRRLADYLERRPMPFRLWLRKTLEERLLMAERQHLGASKRAVRRESPLPENPSGFSSPQLAGSDPTPSQQYVRDESARKVREAIEALPEVDREILLMRNYEGLSYEDVGCILEIEPAAARKRYGRALLRLNQILTELGVKESRDG